MAEMKEVLKTPLFIVKVFQCVLAVTCTALIQSAKAGYGDNIHKTGLVLMVFAGYILITMMDISRMLSGTKTAKNVALLWSVLGVILWITAAAIVIELYRLFTTTVLIHYSGFDKLVASGAIGLINALLFMAETALIIKSEH